MIIKILFLISSLSFASFGNFLDKPNIIFILLDDLGKEWISCYGGENIETPHIDKLASSESSIVLLNLEFKDNTLSITSFVTS